MAELDTNAELQKDGAQAAAQTQQFIPDEWLVTALIFGGALVAVFAGGFGTMYAQSVGMNGGWSPDTAHEAATTFRTLGVLAFIGGLTERVILVIRHSRTS